MSVFEPTMDDVLERLPFPILLTDDAGRLVFCNSASLLFLGRARHWLEEQPVGAWLDAMGAVLPPRIRRSRVATVYFRDTSDCQRRAKVSICPLSGQGWLFTFSESHFGSSEATRTLTVVAGGVAERLEQAVSTIREAASMVLMEGPGDAISEALREVLCGAQLVADLQQEMLNISRQSEVRLVATSLSSLMSSVVPLLREVLEPLMCLDVEASTEPDFVELDAELIKQALLQLARLIVSRCPAGGRCVVRVGSGASEGVRLTFGAEDDHPLRTEALLLPGGDAEEGEYALAVVRGIVEQHNGRILVDGDAGLGTRFHIEFPSARLGSHISVHPPLPRGKETVFVIEDDDSIRPVLVQALELQGYRVIEARNGVEASTILRRRGEEIDLLVADAILPGRSGLDLISEARLLRPQFRVLLITSYSWDVIGGTVPSDIPMLAKPFGTGVFTRRVRKELDGAH